MVKDSHATVTNLDSPVKVINRVVHDGHFWLISDPFFGLFLLFSGKMIIK